MFVNLKNVLRENYPAIEQIEALLKGRKDVCGFFGEALAQLGVMSEARLIKEPKEFNPIKTGSATA